MRDTPDIILIVLRNPSMRRRPELLVAVFDRTAETGLNHHAVFALLFVPRQARWSLDDEIVAVGRRMIAAFAHVIRDLHDGVVFGSHLDVVLEFVVVGTQVLLAAAGEP